MHCDGQSSRGAFDSTIIVGDLDSQKAGRSTLAIACLRKLLDSAADRHAPLTDLSLHQYEAAVRFGAAGVGLEVLNLTPHKARRGGPSMESSRGYRSFQEV